jgi:hypothetical protein
MHGPNQVRLVAIQVLQAMGLPDPPTPLFKPPIWTSFNIIWKSHVWKSHNLLEHAWSKSSSTGQFNWPNLLEHAWSKSSSTGQFN